MNSAFYLLDEKLNNISNTGWIKGINNNSNSSGLTLENMLGIRANFSKKSDFGDIELKCKTDNNCKYNKLTLLTINLFQFGKIYPISRFIYTYGKTNDNCISFCHQLRANKYIEVKSGVYMKLFVYYLEKKVFINIYDCFEKKHKYLEVINFEDLIERVNLKIKNLAYINVKKKKINNINYYHYYNHTFYCIKNANQLIWLMNKGYVYLSFNYKIDEAGRLFNHGIGVCINNLYIDKLFNKIRL